MNFKDWLEINEEETEVKPTADAPLPPNPNLSNVEELSEEEAMTRINHLMKVIQKTEEYGLGMVKFGKNVKSIPHTLLDVLMSCKRYLKYRKDPEQGPVYKEQLHKQVQNLAKIPVGSVLAGLPAIALKVVAIFHHTPLLIVSAVIALVIYYLSYYSMTIAKDVSQTSWGDKWYGKWLVNTGRTLSKWMPDRMRNVMMPEDPNVEETVRFYENMMLVQERMLLG